MALSPVLIVYTTDGTPLPGPVPLQDAQVSDLSGSYIEEFGHCVYTIQKDVFYELLYGVDFIRQHEPMTIVKQIDTMSMTLMQQLLSGTFLPKIEVRWFMHHEKSGKTEEYFRMTLEHVRLHHIWHRLPDAKDPAFERYGHLETIQLVFQKITWLYLKGYITYTDIWDDAYGEFDRKDFTETPMDTEEPTETPIVEKLKITFTSGKFEEPKDGFALDKKATVVFTYTMSRKPTNMENKVYVKLYAVCNGKTEDLHLINEGRLVKDDTWSTEFKLKKPDAYENDNGAVEYYAEIENAYAEGSYKSASIPVGIQTPTLQKMAWNSSYAHRDELVSLTAEFEGVPNNEQATIKIYEFDHDGNHDLMDTIQSNIENNKLEATWKFVYQDDTDDIITEEEAQKNGKNYRPPEYFFTVAIGADTWGDQQESGLLQFKDWIEFDLQDETGTFLADQPFTCFLPDGTKMDGVLDANGHARLDSIPPGPVEVSFTNFTTITIKE